MPGLTKSAPTQAGDVGSQDHVKPSWHNRGHRETRLSGLFLAPVDWALVGRWSCFPSSAPLLPCANPLAPRGGAVARASPTAHPTICITCLRLNIYLKIKLWWWSACGFLSPTCIVLALSVFCLPDSRVPSASG